MDPKMINLLCVVMLIAVLTQGMGHAILTILIKQVEGRVESLEEKVHK